MTGEIHFESERALLVTDVVNLHASIKAKKKIVEFESEESERFEELYRVFKELLEREVDSVAGIEKHRDTIHVLETKLTDADARLSLRDT